MQHRDWLEKSTLPPVAVLGASGRIGRVLRAWWPEAAPVTWIARRPMEGGMRCDPLAEPERLAEILSAAGVRAVLSLAGPVPGGAGGANSAGTETDLAAHAALARVLLGAVPAGVPVLLASSAAVYGRPEETGDDSWLSEAAPLPPRAALSPYGQAKFDMEAAVLAARAAPAIAPVTCLRIGNVAGLDAVLGGWRAGFRLDAFPDGRTPRRSYIGPGQLAAVLAALLMRAGVRSGAGQGLPAVLPAVLNVAAPGTVEMGALLEAAGLDHGRRPAPPTAIPRVALDTRLLLAHLPGDLAAAMAPVTAPALVADWRATQARLPRA
ncbi:MAG: NAD-dependent epimerase/dehydratase family protein [Pseudomonadota bacterium]